MSHRDPSILGPLLFFIFVDDLPNWITNSIITFADDTKTSIKIKDISDSELLQVMHIGHELSTVTMSDGINTTQLETITVQKDLGVYITKDSKVETNRTVYTGCKESSDSIRNDKQAV